MKIASLTLAPLALFLVLAVAPDAHAGLSSCGNIDVEANAVCEVDTGVECTANCTPIHLEAACAASLEVDCRGKCKVNATAECTGSCEGDCEATCEANPGSLDCNASCKAQGEADCDAHCDSGDSKCMASCRATVSGQCQASCTGTPPSASCQAKCQASCQGSCKADVNASCQIDCQTEGYAKCELDLQGGCEAECMRTGDGALYCDGQYVDNGGNLQKCIDAINAVVHVKVQSSAEGSCSNGQCQGMASASASCALTPSSVSGGDLWGLAAAALGLTAFMRRRRAS